MNKVFDLISLLIKNITGVTFRNKSLKETMSKLIDGAEKMGLDRDSLKNAEEFLEYNKYELCFDIIVNQLYEYDTKIDLDYYNFISEVGEKLNIEPNDYLFIYEKINSQSDIKLHYSADFFRTDLLKTHIKGQMDCFYLSR